MPSVPLPLQLWPGLARLWYQGEFRALATALAFFWVADVTVVATFVWTAWLPTPIVWAGWIVLVVGWCHGVWANRRFPRRIARRQGVELASTETDLREAQRAYLQGHLSEAEAALRRVLAECPRDVSAALLLGRVWTRAGLADEARRHLQRLRKWDEALQWCGEIDRELARLVEFGGETMEADDPGQAEASDSGEDRVDRARAA